MDYKGIIWGRVLQWSG